MENLIPEEEFKGSMNEVVLGIGNRALKIGGDASYPFHYFEGALPQLPGIAMEVYDRKPTDWAMGAMEPFTDVFSSPVKWAQKAVETYGAKAILLKLASTDPSRENTSPQTAAVMVRDVGEAVDVPIIVYGSGRKDKDSRVLSQVAKECAGRNLFLGPVVAENLEEIAKSALEYGHGVIVQTALQIGPAKELNIKLTKILPPTKVLFDPTSLALGYGMEFTYSLVEQVRQGAILVNDVNLQMPFFINIANECWSTREAKESKEQGIMWEAITGMTLLLAGANLVVVRHPDVYHLLEEVIKGGAAHV